jgi:hypothetical protein
MSPTTHHIDDLLRGRYLKKRTNREFNRRQGCPLSALVSLANRRRIHPPGIYRRRRPERTVLYQAVQENIETYLSQAHWENPLGDAVPAYVEYDLRQYLTCGIFAHGFARTFCEHDPKMITAVLRIFLDVVDQALRQLSGCNPIKARFGANSTLSSLRFFTEPSCSRSLLCDRWPVQCRGLWSELLKKTEENRGQNAVSETRDQNAVAANISKNCVLTPVFRFGSILSGFCEAQLPTLRCHRDRSRYTAPSRWTKYCCPCVHHSVETYDPTFVQRSL